MGEWCAKILFIGLIVFFFILPVEGSVIGRSYTGDGGNVSCDKVYESKPSKVKMIHPVYVGEKIRFLDENGSVLGGMISGPYLVGGSPKTSTNTIYLSPERLWNTKGKDEGFYKFSNDTDGDGEYFNDSSDYQGWIALNTHEFTIEIDRKITYEGGCIKLKIESNNKPEGVMKLTIKDSDGYPVTDEEKNEIYKIPIPYEGEVDIPDLDGCIPVKNGNILLNTSKLNLREGEYTIEMEDSATEVKKELNFTVGENFILLNYPAKVAKGKIGEVIIDTPFSHLKGRILVDGKEEENFTFDEEGKKKFRWDTEEVSIGRHEISIEVDRNENGKFGDLEDIQKSFFMRVIEGEAKVNVSKEKAVIGECVSIEGESDRGDYAVILIDDVYEHRAPIADGRFEWEYLTIGEVPGIKKVEIFIDAPVDDLSPGRRVKEEWKRENGVDASTTFTLVEPWMTLEVKPEIVEGDEVVVSGSAGGADVIYLLLLDSRGRFVYQNSVPVGNESWSTNITGLDSGKYTILALHSGKDGISREINNGRWKMGDETKTLEEKIQIIKSRARNVESDDILIIREFEVSPPYVEFESSYERGSIRINGTTNLEGIAIVKLGSADVGWEKEIRIENGSINAEFDDVPPGFYCVEVEIPEITSEKEFLRILKRENRSKLQYKPTPFEHERKTIKIEDTNKLPGFGTIEVVIAILLYLRRKF
ncbi:MAG: hypothetical protein ACXQTX_03470 [Candidatus Syntropharchaeia archaeon]